MTIASGCSTAAQLKALDLLAAARATRQPCPPVRGLLPAGDVDAAYAVQSAWVADQIAAGARVIGRKIGLTNPAVQAQFGVDRPDFGVLFDDMACAPGTPIDSARTLQPKIEAEIAFVLAEDLAGPVIGPAEVAAATAYVVAALEIVDSRIAGWDIGIVDTIADNGSSGLFVLGDRRQRLGRLDLAECAMTLRRVAAGQGSAGGQRAGGQRGAGGQRAAMAGPATQAARWCRPGRAPPSSGTRWPPSRGWQRPCATTAARCEPGRSCSPARSARWSRSRPETSSQADISGVGQVSAVFAEGTS